MRDRAHQLRVREHNRYTGKKGKKENKTVSISHQKAIDRYEKLSDTQLREILGGKNLDTSGTKRELIARLTQAEEPVKGSEVKDGLDGLTNDDLGNMLRTRGLPISGSKATKIDRYVRAHTRGHVHTCTYI